MKPSNHVSPHAITIPTPAPSATLQARFRHVLPRAFAQQRELAAERDILLSYLTRADKGECERAREGVARIEEQMAELERALNKLLGMKEVGAMVCEDVMRMGEGGVGFGVSE